MKVKNATKIVDVILASAYVLAEKHFEGMDKMSSRITTLSIANMIINLVKSDLNERSELPKAKPKTNGDDE